MEQNNLRYEAESKTVIFQGKSITLTNHIPVFTPDQREKVRSEIENRLYDAVKKHMESA